MIKRFLILTSICTYQAFMQGAAESHKPRTSGLALMRLQPEFRPITTGSCDDSDILSKTILVEEVQRIQGFHDIGQCDLTALKRSFCHLFIRGSKPEYRKAVLDQLAPFHVSLNLRAQELLPYGSSLCRKEIDQAAEDAKEFPDFYHTPQILSPNGDEIITGQGNRYLTLSAQFMRSLSVEDLKEPNFSQQSQINMAVICITRSKIRSTLSWTVNDEKSPLTNTHSNVEYNDVSQRVAFVMCTQEGRDFATRFLDKPNIKELHRRKLFEDIYQEFLNEANAEPELKLCGVAVMPHISTESN